MLDPGKTSPEDSNPNPVAPSPGVSDSQPSHLPESELEDFWSPPSIWDRVGKIIPIALGLAVVGGVVYGVYRFAPRGVEKVGSGLSSVFKSAPISTPTSALPTPTPQMGEAPSPDSPVDWPTHTLDQQNYTVKVPPDWRIEVYNTDQKMRSYTYFFPPGFRSYPTEIGTDYARHERKKGKSLKGIADFWLDYHLSTDPELTELGPFVAGEGTITVAGSDGVRYNVNFKNSGRRDVWLYFIEDEEDDFMYKIIARDVNEDLLKKFDRMVSTFEFLDRREESGNE